MEHSEVIYQKLEQFIRKFYTNELIRGIILFVGLGLCYFLATLFVEYFLWLKPIGRTILFWTFVLVEVYFLCRFVFFPIFKLLRIQNGINHNDAAAIIGGHFMEVSDKLLNFLQLAKDANKSELLIASIEQKANTLQLVPFGNAINFSANKKYLPFAIAPIILFIFFYVSGNSAVISQSLNRVVHFKEQFSPPAPFEFVVINSKLQVEQNKDFVIRIKTVGKVVPENARLNIGNESYFMESLGSGNFQYTLQRTTEDVVFHIEANGVTSLDYKVDVVSVPSIVNFDMFLSFPAYLNKKEEVIKGNGNATVPEGTKIKWRINTVATENVVWEDGKKRLLFNKASNFFSLDNVLSQSSYYQIVTSNYNVKSYEKLRYQIVVVKDLFPTISTNTVADTLGDSGNTLVGQIADDHGLHKLQVVYYPRGNTAVVKRVPIALKSKIFDQFIFSFPGTLLVDKGVSYEYFFEVYDNDELNGYKSTKSAVFSSRILSDEELQEQELAKQSEGIGGLEKSLKSQAKQMAEMDKLQKVGKEKDKLDFKDQQKINDFIKRQNQQDQIMKGFAEKLKESLKSNRDVSKDEFKENLQKRLDNVDKDLEKNKKLLEELKSLNDKISQDELLDKMDKFKQTAKNQSKSLEQLVELTKKFYVQKKLEQLKEKLVNLAQKQEEISNSDAKNTKENQTDINKDFDKIQKELDEVVKENKELKKPVDISDDKEKQNSIDNDLKKASEELQKDKKETAKPKQKNAAKKMKEMAQQMESDMESGEMEQLQEDVAMLRQICDNLLAFSFSQEDVMNKVKGFRAKSSTFNTQLKVQQDLKLQFKHVDDSLFALSLRNPKIGENITKEVGNAQYNIDKSLEKLVDGELSKGVSHQQYVVAAANKLADGLSDMLNNMQMSMSGQGKGKPKPGQNQGQQLSDIIKKQQGLGEKIKEGMGKDQKSGTKSGSEKGKGSSQAGGKSKEGEEAGDGEGNAKAIMEIYKEQKELRDALEKELEKQGLGGAGQTAIEQMKEVEKQLLNKGFKNETLQKAMNIKQELLKLNTAIQEQGQDTKRQAEVNKKEFSNQAKALSPAVLNYLNSIEILNRQSLPLRSNFNQKVQDYFNSK